MKNKYQVAMWDQYYAGERRIHIKPKSGLFASYDIFLCDRILDQYLPVNRGSRAKLKICEIGCGDGKLLKKIAANFNYEPFGIDYSKEAIKQTKKIGIKTIQGNIFNKDLLERYKERFDIVYSYGFVEHITPPQEAVKAHLHLLKEGGYFFIQIPRLKGFNYLKAKIFRPDILPLHNLKIMEQNALKSVCEMEGIEELFCKNYGTFKLRIPLEQKGGRWYILKAICALEYFLNPLCRLALGEKGFETKWFSPGVIFIGRKMKPRNNP